MPNPVATAPLAMHYGLMDRQPDPADAALLDGATLKVPLPPVPDGQFVAVAVWREGDIAAILRILPDIDDKGHCRHELTSFQRSAGHWRSLGTGRGSWWARFGGRSPFARPVLLGSIGLPANDGGVVVWLGSGIAPMGVLRVGVRLGDFRSEAGVEPVTGAFLVTLPAKLPSRDSVEAVMLDQPAIVAAYWNQYKLRDDPVDADDGFWAWELVDEGARNGSDWILDVVLALAKVAPDDYALGYLGAGPVEDLLRDHGERFIDTIDAIADAHSEFAKTLAGINYEADTESRKRVEDRLRRFRPRFGQHLSSDQG